jgi:gamma-glutamyltranspeptidase/glutathione hydrolase
MKISIRIAAAALLFTTSMSMSARDRSNARSMVITRYGIVATSHVQASVAGAHVLARGGSAVDAAIAANAVLGVTEPMMNGAARADHRAFEGEGRDGYAGGGH